LQAAVERLGQGLPAWSPNQPAPQSKTELRSVFFGLVHLQRFQEGQWRRLTGTIASMGNLVRRLHDALAEIRRSTLFEGSNQANFERMILERALREVDLLDQQQKTLYSQSTQLYHDAASFDTPNTPTPHNNQAHHLQPVREQATHQPHKALSLPEEQTAWQFTSGAKDPGRDISSSPDQAAFYKLYQAYYQNGKSTDDL
jgi:hypothetical protein